MIYISVTWHHSHSDEPVELVSELDSERYEVRKVEIYRDGRKDFANSSSRSGNTALGYEPIPPLNEIAADDQFTPRMITKEEFEVVWLEAIR
jgi:hypothetical protein